MGGGQTNHEWEEALLQILHTLAWTSSDKDNGSLVLAHKASSESFGSPAHLGGSSEAVQGLTGASIRPTASLVALALRALRHGGERDWQCQGRTAP